MYLRALEIQGFKSFADKTRLVFEKNITAVVGPNGSGKSNISDALLWVMGEQRTRALRGGKMEDVIFGGTEKRNPTGFAQVSLILDNSDGTLKLDSSEVMITRRYYRSGESEYFINREGVRLRDINELLMDTGLGRDGYSIIGQGKIADIVSVKSTQRREVFEEAAGISRFRYRKEESERKLLKTDENLLRVRDKISELELQVGPLKRQSETAKRYLTLRDELKVLEVSLWLHNLENIKSQLVLYSEDFARTGNELLKLQQEMDRLYSLSEQHEAAMEQWAVSLENVRDALAKARESASETESAMAVLTANRRNNCENRERHRAEQKQQTERAESIEHQIGERQKRLEDIKSQQEENSIKTRELLRYTQENDEESGKTAKELEKLILKESELKAAAASQDAILSMLSARLGEFRQREHLNREETAEMSERSRQIMSQLEHDRLRLSEIRSKHSSLQQTIQHKAWELDSQKQRCRELAEEKTGLTIKARSMDSRIGMLTEMEKEYEGFSKAVKTVMRQSSGGVLKGIHGPAGSLLKTEDSYVLAVETALGAGVSNIVTDNQDRAKAAIELLKSQNAGRATFLPLDVIKGSLLKGEPEGEEGYLGTALSLISFEPEYEEIFKNLLGRTLVVESLEDAVKISKKYKNRFRIVTLDGQLINAGGSMTGGSWAKGAGVLSRANERKKLIKKREALEGELSVNAGLMDAAQRSEAQSREQLASARERLDRYREKAHIAEGDIARNEMLQSSACEAVSALEEETETLKRRISEETEKSAQSEKLRQGYEQELVIVRNRITELSAGRDSLARLRGEISDEILKQHQQLAALGAEADETVRTIHQLGELKEDITRGIGSRSSAIHELERELSVIDGDIKAGEIRLGKLKDEIDRQKKKLDAVTLQRMQAEGERNSVQRSLQEKNRELVDMERICAKLEQKKLTAELTEKQIIDKLWDSYELSHTAAQEINIKPDNINEASKRAAVLKKDMSALGEPNIGAIEQYKTVKERYDFLTEQRDDVLKAKGELLKIISDITREMKEIFASQFKVIDDSFKKTFEELFGGGKASLELDDERDVLNCGIEIKAQPPGKQLRAISLLSGGEKAFVAIALYFAIMKVRPTPFCVMDEIEAALDEANVLRFAQYMRSMSDKTQFIAITHRRGTMEEADVLYGVTMEEKGISKVLALDLEEAEKTIA